MRLSSLALLAAALGAAAAAALDGGGSGFSPDARAPLAGRGFATSYPGTWTRSVSRPVAGSAEFRLSSRSSGLDTAGVPVPGGIGITVAQLPIAVLARSDPAAGG